jgi:hypothetical protein
MKNNLILVSSFDCRTVMKQTKEDDSRLKHFNNQTVGYVVLFTSQNAFKSTCLHAYFTTTVSSVFESLIYSLTQSSRCQSLKDLRQS